MDEQLSSLVCWFFWVKGFQGKYFGTFLNVFICHYLLYLFNCKNHLWSVESVRYDSFLTCGKLVRACQRDGRRWYGTNQG